MYALAAHAQTAPLVRRVIDAESQKPLDYVTVHLSSSKVPAFTDELGQYILRTYSASDTVTFTVLGSQKRREAHGQAELPVPCLRKAVPV